MAIQKTGQCIIIASASQMVRCVECGSLFPACLDACPECEKKKKAS